MVTGTLVLKTQPCMTISIMFKDLVIGENTMNMEQDITNSLALNISFTSKEIYCNVIVTFTDSHNNSLL